MSECIPSVEVILADLNLSADRARRSDTIGVPAVELGALLAYVVDLENNIDPGHLDVIRGFYPEWTSP